MGEISTFSREFPEKSTRGHTDFIYGIESSLCGETLCKRRQIIEIRFPRYSWIWESIFRVNGEKSTFSRELPEKSTRGHTDLVFGIEPPACVGTLCKIEVMFKKDDEDKHLRVRA
jgi:hypothetical protein